MEKLKRCENCRFWDPEQLIIDMTEHASDADTGEVDGSLLDLVDGLGYCRANPPAPGFPDSPWDTMAVSPVQAWCGQYDQGIDFDLLDEELRRQREVNDAG